MKALRNIVLLTLALCLLSGCATQIPKGRMMTDSPITTPDPAGVIGEEKAKEIALNYFEITVPDNIRFDRTELDFENGTWVYELEFRQGTIEYDIDIKADDGTVLAYEKDVN